MAWGGELNSLLGVVPTWDVIAFPTHINQDEAVEIWKAGITFSVRPTFSKELEYHAALFIRVRERSSPYGGRSMNIE